MDCGVVFYMLSRDHVMLSLLSKLVIVYSIGCLLSYNYYNHFQLFLKYVCISTTAVQLSVVSIHSCVVRIRTFMASIVQLYHYFNSNYSIGSVPIYLNNVPTRFYKLTKLYMSIFYLLI